MLFPSRGPLQPRATRALHLLHSLFSSSDVEMLQHVRKKSYPTADEVSLKLLEKGKKEPTTMKLSEALARFEPLSYLVQTKVGTEETPGTYRFLKFNDPGLPSEKTKKSWPPKGYYKRKGRSKETHLNTDCPASLLRHRIKLAYGFLMEGSRMEFHLRAKAVARAESVDSALRHHLHLRPDTLLAAMPPGTTMLALPATVQLPNRNPQDETKLSVNKTSDVFWAMEYKPALERFGVSTPPRIKALGTWQDHRKYVEHAMEKRQEDLRIKRLARARDESVRSRPRPKVKDGDIPHLSDLMPKDKREEDEPSKEGPSLRPSFKTYHPLGRK